MVYALVAVNGRDHDRSWMRSWFVQLSVDHDLGHGRVHDRS